MMHSNHSVVQPLWSKISFWALIAVLALVSAGRARERLNPLLTHRSIPWSGTDALRAHEYERALEQLSADTVVTDSAYHQLKLGLAYKGLGEWGMAMRCLRRAARLDSILSPVAHELMGEVDLAQGRWKNALSAFRLAASLTENQRYEYSLYDRMYGIAGAHRDSLGSLAWLEELAAEAPGEEREDVLTDAVAEMMADSDWAGLDSLVTAVSDTTTFVFDAGCAGCSLMVVDSIPDSLFSTPVLFALSRGARSCGLLGQASDWLHRALDRPDFPDRVPRKLYMYYRAGLNYDLGNWNNAVRWFKKYKEKYGPTPELVYLMARSYRALGNGRKASYWYDLHVKLYPGHHKSHDILWYRAWQKEEQGDHDSARDLYLRVYRDHRRRSRGDDAYFRYGLSFFREDKYESAHEAFSKFVRRFPRSSLVSAARYWNGLALLAIGRKEDASEQFHTTIEHDPLDFYAFRAAEQLLGLGDTVTVLEVDTLADSTAVVQWLDSISPGSDTALSGTDSLALAVGTRLAALGLSRQAEYLLEPIEISYPRAIRLQFELASLYRLCGAPARSFLVARSLAWRIPPENRRRMPRAVYEVLYPPLFETLINRYAADYEVTPTLVSSIIRQESIFDPAIVSPVGAIGLMQIMPYTGKQIATELQEPFTPDSLYNPSVNIRFGSYYIKQLLDQFSGDLVKAIAGYNGGPHNVKRWAKRNKDHSFDLFIEDIGYTETRGYVKKVLANYWTYQLLSPSEFPVVADKAAAAEEGE